jgi:hypothetical protein
MAQQTINIGTVANDGTGDPLRTAFDKVNDNFTELYNDDAGDVDSVNGQTGTVVLDSDDIAEGATNEYLLADSVSYAKLAAAYKATLDEGNISGTYALDFENYIWFVGTMTANTTINISNFNRGDVKYMLIDGDFELTLTAGGFTGKVVSGAYDGTVTNLIQIVKHTNLVFYSIAQVPV